MDYTEADRMLHKHGVRRSSVKIGNNTWLEARGSIRLDAHRRERDAIALRLYATDVITFTASGLVIYDSNRWRTPTTRNRMDRGPFRVFSSGGIWFVGDRGRFTDDGRFEPGATVEYFDGITIDTATGAVVNHGYTGEQTIRANRHDIENRRVLPLIDTYVRKLKVAAGTHERDCPGCTDGGSRAHLTEHLNSRLYPGALLRHAASDWGGMPPRTIRPALRDYLTDRLTLRAPLYAAA